MITDDRGGRSRESRPGFRVRRPGRVTGGAHAETATWSVPGARSRQGVGPWDAWIREGKSALPQPLPLIPGSDISGIVEGTGSAVGAFSPGDEIYGVTNKRFTGGYAEYALAEAGMIAPKPTTLDHVQAASVAVVAVTAWQMLFEHANLSAGAVCLVHGAAGNAGPYGVQLARQKGITVIATASANCAEYLRQLGAERVIDYRTTSFEAAVKDVDAVIDLGRRGDDGPVVRRPEARRHADFRGGLRAVPGEGQAVRC